MKRGTLPVGENKTRHLLSSLRDEKGSCATISQGVRAFDLRRSRSIGLAKTRLQHVSIAVAINIVRIVAWLDGDLPAPTRVSAFQRLYSTA